MSRRTLAILAGSAFLLFLVIDLAGSFGPNLMENGKCFSLLGCNTGFFGYDLVVHFVSGIADVAIIVWLAKRFTSLNLFHESLWKNILICVALAVLIGFIWEFVELCWDQYRLLVLHQNIIVPNKLYEPSNQDTMGDMFASLVGALLTVPLYTRFFKTRK